MTKHFMKGNEAISEAAVRAGCTFFAGYPITPQNEIPEYMSRRLPEVDGIFVQAESETAASNMIYGAAAAGARAMTSSTGVGIALKSEGIAHIATAELPCVVVNVMRGGPGTGSVQPSQQDYNQATKAPTCGGSRMVVFSPASVQEAVDLTYKAFDVADKYRNPAMILTDACIGNMMEAIVLPELKTDLPDKSSWILSGAKDRNNRRLCSYLSSDVNIVEDFSHKMSNMFKTWEEEETMVEEYLLEDAEVVVVAYGIVGRFAKLAVETLREEGIKAGMIRPITIFPFPNRSFEQLNSNVAKQIISFEMAIPGQMLDDVKLANNGKLPVDFYGHSGGVLVTTDDIIEKVREWDKDNKHKNLVK